MRNLYHVSISFQQPAEATIPISAETPEQAQEIATKMFAQRSNFQIHDVYDVKDCPAIQEMIEEADEDLDLDDVPVIPGTKTKH